MQGGLRHVERGRDPEEQSGQHRKTDRESKDPQIDSDLPRSRQASRCRNEQRSSAPRGEEQAEPTAEAGQDDALGEQLSDHARATGAERGAHLARERAVLGRISRVALVRGRRSGQADRGAFGF